MHIAEKLASSIRHSRKLERASWLWNGVRPVYDRLISAAGRSGLKRVMNGTDAILVSPACRGVAEEYEPEVWHRLMAEVKSGDTVADVGTFIGLYTVALAKRVAPSGRVFGFEPNPEIFTLLSENVRLNQHEDSVTLFRAAVGASCGEVAFAPAASVSHIVAEEKADTALRVSCVTLDDVFEGERVDVMKIDVEGYEEKVLEGAKLLLSDASRSPRVLYIEVHPYAWGEVGATSDSLLDLLKKYGYEVMTLEGEPVRSITEYGEIIARKIT